MPELKPEEYMEQMNSKQKLSYIWEYYKLPIIAVLIAIVAVSYFIYEQKTKDIYVLDVMLIGDSMEYDKQQELSDTITEQFVREYSSNSREKANVEFVPVTIDNGQRSLSYEYVQKLMACMAAGQLDVMVMDESIYQSYAEQGAFLNLEELGIVIPQGKGDEVIEAKDEDGKAYTAGIRFDSGDGILSAVGFDSKDKIICVSVNTNHKETSGKVVQWLINQ